MTTATLTANEAELLNALVAEGLDCMGGKKPSDLLEDNMTWFGHSDVMRLMSCDRHAASSFMGGLLGKGIVADYGEGGTADWYVTDAGIRLAHGD